MESRPNMNTAHIFCTTLTALIYCTCPICAPKYSKYRTCDSTLVIRNISTDTPTWSPAVTLHFIWKCTSQNVDDVRHQYVRNSLHVDLVTSYH